MKTATKDPQELRSEVQILQAQKDSLEQQAQSIRITLEQDVQAKMASVRKENILLNEQKNKLVSEKSEFETLMQNFKKERDVFEKVRTDFENKRTANENSMANITSFIRIVREASSKL